MPAPDPVAALQAEVAVLEERKSHVLASLADAEELLAARRHEIAGAEARLSALRETSSGGE